MRFIHAADIHLDTAFSSRSDEVRKRLREASRVAFERLVDLALAEQVHAVLLSGDLFDDGRLSFQTESFLLEQLHRLRQAVIPVVYATGNHDPGREGQRSAELAWPSNVTVVRLRRSAGTVLSCMNRPASAIQGVGRDQPGVGVNRKWSGSISRQMITTWNRSYH